jgi:hypothetical protein
MKIGILGAGIMTQALGRQSHQCSLATAHSASLVPWNRDVLHKSRSAAPGWQGATSEHIGHM